MLIVVLDVPVFPNFGVEYSPADEEGKRQSLGSALDGDPVGSVGDSESCFECCRLKSPDSPA